MLSCKDLAKKTLSEEPFTKKEKVERWVHLMMCHTCRIFMKQMENLERSLKLSLKKDLKSYEKEREALKNKILEETKKQSS